MFFSYTGDPLPFGMILKLLLPRLNDNAGYKRPLRDGKVNVFQGGVRVPAIVRWANEARRKFGPAKWEASSFQVTDEDKSISIELKTVI